MQIVFIGLNSALTRRILW